ncbi:MAG: GspMb/PilO family protein [Gemmatimonadaceae bacterium]
MTRERVARLRGLADQETQLVAAADARQEAGVGVVRLLRGRTVALVASDLQSLLQDHARLSRVSVSRLEVSNGADSAASLEQRVSASVSAVTDIYGLADLLNRLHSSTVLLSLDEVHVAPNPVLRGNLLQVALTVRAPFVLEP